MVNNAIGMNLVTLRRGTEAATLLPNLDRIRHAGFQGVGLWKSNILQWLDAGLSIADLREHIVARNLKVDEICFAEVLKPDGTVADQRQAFEWAAALEAHAVISIYFRPDNPLEKVQDDWAEFVRSIEDFGIPAAFEFIGPWPNYNSPLSAWEAIKQGPKLGTLVFDTFHFWRGGCDLSQIPKVPGERVSLVHLNDANDVPRETAVDADRTYPGEGVLPLKEILGGLIGNGFAGPLSVEIFGEAQEESPAKVCKRAYETARKVIAAL